MPLDRRKLSINRNRAFILLGFIVLVMLGLYFSGTFRFVSGLQALTTQRQTQLIYYIDHAALAKEMREFADRRRLQIPVAHSAPSILWDNDPDFPSSLKIMQCNSIVIFPDRIQLEFGGPLLHFGINVFDKEIRGHGNKELSDGVWFYSEDGRVPSR